MRATRTTNAQHNNPRPFEIKKGKNGTKTERNFSQSARGRARCDHLLSKGEAPPQAGLPLSRDRWAPAWGFFVLFWLAFSLRSGCAALVGSGTPRSGGDGEGEKEEEEKMKKKDAGMALCRTAPKERARSFVGGLIKKPSPR